MPRTARIVIPEVSLHVVQRGHDQQDCFFNESDYLAYLGYLREFAPRFGCSVHAYCLMTNHVHLFMTPHAANACSQVMKFTGQHYVAGAPRKRGRPPRSEESEKQGLSLFTENRDCP